MLLCASYLIQSNGGLNIQTKQVEVNLSVWLDCRLRNTNVTTQHVLDVRPANKETASYCN